MKKNRILVILRCGDKSLHRDWCAPERSWDLAASYFGDDANLAFPEATYVHRYKGGKWDGIFDFCRQNPSVLEAYDYFWFPDDDIAATPETLEQLFSLVIENNFELAQPSLRSGSYVSHLITLHNPKFVYRNVNFVELMVPLVSRSLFKKVLPLFETAKSGFGIDFVWHRFTSDPGRKVAIIDATQVVHTRPVGGALHSMIKKTGAMTPLEELELFLKPYGNVAKNLISFGGLTVDGRRIEGKTATSVLAMQGWLSKADGNCGFTKKLPAAKFALWVVRQTINALYNTPQLEITAPRPPAAITTVSSPSPGALRTST